MPRYGHLPDDLRAQLCGHIQVFLDEKQYEGCGGLTITDEIRVTIAAHACLLLLSRDTDYYPELISILVYPSTYKVSVTKTYGILEVEHDSVRLGESWTEGKVILSWDAVLHGSVEHYDGQNVALHEFAHQLDQEDGVGDGAPILPVNSMYTSWARVLGDEFDALRSKTVTGDQSVLDKYGATHPAEFFAVATEAFFEKPDKLKRKHPELYDQLKQFYRLDTAAMFG